MRTKIQKVIALFLLIAIALPSILLINSNSALATTQIVEGSMLYGSVEDASAKIAEHFETNDILYIVNETQLRGLAKYVNAGNNCKDKTIILLNDIVLSDEDWEPIGDYNTPFSGTFEGNNHSISNICIDNNGVNWFGLFETNLGGTINNLTANIGQLEVNNSCTVGCIVARNFGEVNYCKGSLPEDCEDYTYKCLIAGIINDFEDTEGNRYFGTITLDSIYADYFSYEYIEEIYEDRYLYNEEKEPKLTICVKGGDFNKTVYKSVLYNVSTNKTGAPQTKSFDTNIYIESNNRCEEKTITEELSVFKNLTSSQLDAITNNGYVDWNAYNLKNILGSNQKNYLVGNDVLTVELILTAETDLYLYTDTGFVNGTYIGCEKYVPRLTMGGLTFTPYAYKSMEFETDTSISKGYKFIYTYTLTGEEAFIDSKNIEIDYRQNYNNEELLYYAFNPDSNHVEDGERPERFVNSETAIYHSSQWTNNICIDNSNGIEVILSGDNNNSSIKAGTEVTVTIRTTAKIQYVDSSSIPTLDILFKNDAGELVKGKWDEASGEGNAQIIDAYIDSDGKTNFIYKYIITEGDNGQIYGEILSGNITNYAGAEYDLTTIEDPICISSTCKTDTVIPTVIINGEPGNNVGSIRFTLTFEELVEVYYDGLIYTTNGDLGTLSNRIDNADGTYSYTIDVNNIDKTKEVELIVFENAFKDAAGNTNIKTSETIMDDEEPTLEITLVGLEASGELEMYMFKFNEIVDGFTPEDISITDVLNEDIKMFNFGADKSEYTMYIKKCEGTERTISVAAGVCTDMWGNSNKEASLTIDRKAPILSTLEVSDQEDEEITIKATFDENIKGTVPSLELLFDGNTAKGNLEAGVISNNTITWKYTIDCDDIGEFSLNIQNLDISTLSDEAGNISKKKADLTLTGDKIIATGHKGGEPERENEVEATCKEDGSYDEVVKCKVCGVEISRTNETISKDTVAHKEETVIENRVEATCKEDGSYDEVVKCTECGVEISRTNETISKDTVAHKKETVPGKAATCKETGLTEGKKCSVCGEVIVEQQIISKTAHTEGEPKRENVVGATCEVPGSYDEVVYCKVCNAEMSRTEKKDEKIPHTEVTDAAVAPGCTTTGKTEGKHCSVCNEVLIAQTVVPATGHSFGNWIEEKAATYEEDGLKVRTCTNCDETEEEVIPKLTNENPEIIFKDEDYEVITNEETKYVKINAGATKEEIIANMDEQGIAGQTITIEKLTEDEKIKTGSEIKMNGETKVIIVVKGDVNCDGDVDFIEDIMTANRARLGFIELDTMQQIAADIDNDSEIDFINDLIAINRIRINLQNALKKLLFF